MENNSFGWLIPAGSHNLLKKSQNQPSELARIVIKSLIDSNHYYYLNDEIFYSNDKKNRSSNVITDGKTIYYIMTTGNENRTYWGPGEKIFNKILKYTKENSLGFSLIFIDGTNNEEIKIYHFSKNLDALAKNGKTNRRSNNRESFYYSFEPKFLIKTCRENKKDEEPDACCKENKLVDTIIDIIKERDK